MINGLFKDPILVSKQYSIPIVLTLVLLSNGFLLPSSALAASPSGVGGDAGAGLILNQTGADVMRERTQPGLYGPIWPKDLRKRRPNSPDSDGEPVLRYTGKDVQGQVITKPEASPSN